MAADYQHGASLQALARKYHVDDATARRHIVLIGIDIRGVKVGIPPEELESTRKLRAEGWTYAALAKHYGCSTTAVSRALRKSSG